MSKKPKSKNKRLTLLKEHKLIVFLSGLLIAVVLVTVAIPKYKDWDNAQLIKGLARDFPILVEEIEQATGLDLEIESNCSTTTEKFSSGVKTCEISVSKSEASSEQLELAFNQNLKTTLFDKGREFENGLGYYYKYRNKNSCTFRTSKSIYNTCIIAVREANTKLAIDEFSKIN